MKEKSHEIDMCSCPLFSGILLFVIPLMFSNILQLFFNAADVIVVGRFVGKESLAAVGSTTSIVFLMINLFIGFSIGTNVITARYIGEKNNDAIYRSIHTSVAISITSGLILAFVGVLLARKILIWMGSPGDVIDKAEIYLKIYFCGMPVIMLYNFSAAVLRAFGDTKRPLYYLTLAGIINVILNLFFVIYLNMDTAGVALATVISQFVSAILTVRCLAKLEEKYRLRIKKIRFYKTELLNIMKVGLPAGLQNVMFSISNVIIQSSINSFGSSVIAASAASASIENFTYTAMNSFQFASMSFVSQNFGAKNFIRAKKAIFTCAFLVIAVGLVMGFSTIFFGKSILSIYSNQQDVIEIALERLKIMCPFYFTCGLMDTFAGGTRSLGYSFMAMVVALVFICGLRIVWIYTIFIKIHTLTMLFASYPISWIAGMAFQLLCLVIVFKKVKRATLQNAEKC
ncbi:MAG: MATE family efflux transporter [Clostridia bacterium]|jgi:putative MATE family efflux protein|nr:MATE family efflux transporter [Clostridia bacterium]MCI2015593.1 MATE family efflux transporter [Clostridia bacterium]